MRSLFFICLLISFIFSCPKAQATEHKNADKVLAVLKSVDIHSPLITQTAQYIDENTKDGYLYFGEQGMQGIKLQLRYDTGGLDTENIQLNITEEGAKYNLTGNQNGVMLHYKLEF